MWSSGKERPNSTPREGSSLPDVRRAVSPESGRGPAPEPRPESSFLFFTGSCSVDQRNVLALIEAIERVWESSDGDGALEQVVDSSIELCGAERGFLITVDEQGRARVEVARSKQRQTIRGDLRFSTSVVQRVLESGQPTRAEFRSDASTGGFGNSILELGLRAVMCVPLARDPQSRDRRSGVLYLDCTSSARRFSSYDANLLSLLARHAANALRQRVLRAASLEKARLEQLLEAGQATQARLLASVPHSVPGFDIHGFYRPAERTSGDFFDFVSLRGGRLAAVVGDVSGHGIGPALITHCAQGFLRSALRMEASPDEALAQLNRDLAERIEPGKFLTLLLLAIDSNGGVEVHNAGHHGPILLRRGTFVTQPQHGLALGLAADAEFSVDARLALTSGDVLLAFTDGLVEAHSVDDRSQLFGEERVRKILDRHVNEGSDARTITQALADAAFEFAGGQHEDDITLVAIRRL
jgi:serine phosphatase RsbU (regulator of sigma subunit)